MLFNSWRYAAFLPVVFALYWVPPHRFRWPLPLAALMQRFADPAAAEAMVAPWLPPVN